VTAVDNSRVGIDIARSRVEDKGLDIDFRVLDLEKGEFNIRPETYDLICDFYYLQRDLFAAMKAGVRLGGLVISTIHIYGEGEDSEGFLLQKGELRRYFSDFDIIHYYETSAADTDAGDHHRRTAEIIARRPLQGTQ
jgi:tellurite methyltransferase